MNLIDTDVIIELLRVRKHEVGAISIITLVEVLRGLQAGKRAKAKELLEESFDLLNLDNEAIETYCNLYDKIKGEGTTVPEADLLIAATAISHEMALKTRDEHFERLEKLGLKLVHTD